MCFSYLEEYGPYIGQKLGTSKGQSTFIAGSEPITEAGKHFLSIKPTGS